MPHFNRRLIFLLVTIVMIVSLIGFSLKDRENLSWAEQFVMDTTGLVQAVFQKPAHFVAGFFESLEDIKNTYEQNKLLKEKMESFVLLETELLELKKENETLRQLINQEESLKDFTTIHASVITRNPDRWHEVITLNRGQVHGVEKDMAVMTSKGLIGKVKSVSQFTSKVQLLSALNRENKISSVVQGEEEVFGLIEGYDEERKELYLRKIPYGASIEISQRVITSGLGGVFPKGLLIGEISEIKEDEYGLTKMAYVKPLADFYVLDDVLIVKRTMVSPTDTSEEENQ